MKGWIYDNSLDPTKLALLAWSDPKLGKHISQTLIFITVSEIFGWMRVYGFTVRFIIL